MSKSNLTGEILESTWRRAGFYALDARKILIEYETVSNLLVEPVQISLSVAGLNGFIRIDLKSARFAYLKTFDNCTMMPQVHKNTFTFLGVGPTEEMLIMREKNNIFTVFNKQEFIQSWSMNTAREITDKRFKTLRVGVPIKNFQKVGRP